MPAKTIHLPTRFSTYQATHNNLLGQFKDRDFVGKENLCFTPSAQGIFLEGEIGCLGNIVIAVEKFLEILDGDRNDAMVQTLWYSYNVFIRGQYNLFRYDNQDDDFLRPGHQDEHHKHCFDWRTGEEVVGSPIWMGVDKWPTLGQVIAEVEDWYWEHREDIADPDGYPSIDVR